MRDALVLNFLMFLCAPLLLLPHALCATLPTRRGGRRPREDDGDAPTKTKRGRQPKFIPLSQNVDFSLGSSLDGDSARETFKYVPVAALVLLAVLCCWWAGPCGSVAGLPGEAGGVSTC